jgi:hypothetical protein
MKNRLTKLTFLLLTAVLAIQSSYLSGQKLEIQINNELQRYTDNLVENLDKVPKQRELMLSEISKSMSTDYLENKTGKVLFVCTHNSRRSQIAEVWFKYATLYFGIQHFEAYSGGIEETAFNERAIKALERAGFTTHYVRKVENPVVSITPGNYPVWDQQSKIYTHRVNPKKNFTALMVCSDADKSCPIVEGATDRFSLPYDDPRYYDGTPSEEKMYDATVEEIGLEMFYLVSQIKQELIYKMEASK